MLKELTGALEHLCLRTDLKTLYKELIMSQPQILIQFKKSLVCFLNELIDAFPGEKELIIIQIYISNQVSIKDILDTFLFCLKKDDGKLELDIASRNEHVFTRNELFSSMSTRLKSFNFNRLWSSGTLDDDEREIIWKWIDSFVELTNKYSDGLSS